MCLFNQLIGFITLLVLHIYFVDPFCVVCFKLTLGVRKEKRGEKRDVSAQGVDEYTINVHYY